jgi:DNA helicase-2/ATP-dependent DNA helicase PcrA
VSPDAIRIMTVHQAKGLQWPAVFIPGNCVRNRFPARKVAVARTAWHLSCLRAGIRQQPRATEGGIEDERRLFYVAT